MAEKNTVGMIKKRQEYSAAIKMNISKTIDKLVKDRQPVNVSSVARQANCSKNTVRKHDDLMERIEGLRAVQSKKGSIVEPKQGKKNHDDRMIALHDKNKELEQKVNQVIEQLIDQTELQIEIDRLKADNTRLVKRNVELENIKSELVKNLEELTVVLDKRRDTNAALNLVNLSQKETAVTTREDPPCDQNHKVGEQL